LCDFFHVDYGLQEVVVVCGGHLMAMNSLVEIGRDICLLLKGGREIIPIYWCKNPLTIEDYA